MDMNELGSMLQMQNESQLLLKLLQQRQSEFKSPDSSFSSTSEHIQNGHDSYHIATELQRDNAPERSRSALASKIRKQELLHHLKGTKKLQSYRKVSTDDKPGTKASGRLAQGIENNKFLFGDESPWSENCELNTHQSRNKSGKFHEQNEEEDDKANNSVSFCDDVETQHTPPMSAPFLSATPRSILKHRKIIDDNVRVASEYSHTPISLVTPRGKNGLNYSYSTLDNSGDGSYIEDCTSKNENTHSPLDMKEQSKMERMAELEEIMRDRLLADPGNDRKNASIVQELNHRPKSYVFEAGSDSVENVSNASNNKTTAYVELSKPTGATLLIPVPPSTDPSQSNKLWRSRDKPLLGYDWIASDLDNDSLLYNMSDDYFWELQKFRNQHRNVCQSDAVSRNNYNLTRPISPEIQDPAHKCLHGYTVNERLFTEPMNPDEEGRSVCPICLSSRQSPSEQSPGFVRVSIPRSTLSQTSRIKPHRRRSFDATDSYALSQHCLAGYECSLPTTIPTAKNLDIRAGIKGKQTMTLQEAEDFVKSHSRKSRLMTTHPAQLAAKNRDDNSFFHSLSGGNDVSSLSLTRGAEDSSSSRTGGTEHSSSSLTRGTGHRSNSLTRGVYPGTGSASRDQTDTLLDTSRNLRYDLQDLTRKKGQNKHRKPHSTNYPVL